MPSAQIMENEFVYLADRRGLGGYFSEEFVKDIIPSPSNHVFHNAIWLSLL